MGVTRLISFQESKIYPYPNIYEIKLYIKKSRINYLKVLFLFHRLYITF